MTLTITAIPNPEYPDKSIQYILDKSYNSLWAKFIVIQDQVFQKVAEIILFDGEQNHRDIMCEYCQVRGNAFLVSGKIKKTSTSSSVEFDPFNPKKIDTSSLLKEKIQISIDAYSKEKGIFHFQEYR